MLPLLMLLVIACSGGNVIPAAVLSPTPVPVDTPTPVPTPVPTLTPTETPLPRFTLAVDVRPDAAALAGASITGAGEYEEDSRATISAKRVTNCDGTSDYVFDSWIGVDVSA